MAANLSVQRSDGPGTGCLRGVNIKIIGVCQIWDEIQINALYLGSNLFCTFVFILEANDLRNLSPSQIIRFEGMPMEIWLLFTNQIVIGITYRATIKAHPQYFINIVFWL